MAQLVKKRLPVQEMQVRSLGQENSLEQKMAAHSSIFAWKISWTEEPDGLQSMGHRESDTTERTHMISCILQCVLMGRWCILLTWSASPLPRTPLCTKPSFGLLWQCCSSMRSTCIQQALHFWNKTCTPQTVSEYSMTR